MDDLLGALETEVTAPSISSGVMVWGAKWFKTMAAGSRTTSLLIREPRAIFQMIGSSRSGLKPCTYLGVTAASSMTTPAVLEPASAAAAAMSSTLDAATLAMAATSSRRARRPLMRNLLIQTGEASTVAT